MNNMGYNTAVDLAQSGFFTMEDSVRYHLSGNFFPSIPSYMVQPCIDAIEAYNNGDSEELIKLPLPVYQGNKDLAPAISIIRAHHLEPWLSEFEDNDDWEEEEES